MKRLFLPISAVTALLAACVTPPPPPEAAALEFSTEVSCTETFQQTAAIDMTPETEEGITVRRSALDGESNCITTINGAVPYALYKLPAANNIASINAGSIFEPARVLGANVHFLNADMEPMRSFRIEEMRHRGSTLSVLVQPREEEVFVVIVADRSSAGSAYNRSRPDNGEEIATDSVAYSIVGQSFVRIYYFKPENALPES